MRQLFLYGPYEATWWDPSSSLIVTGTRKIATPLDTITFEDDGAGSTRLTYEPRLAATGVLRRAKPVLQKGRA